MSKLKIKNFKLNLTFKGCLFGESHKLRASFSAKEPLNVLQMMSRSFFQQFQRNNCFSLTISICTDCSPTFSQESRGIHAYDLFWWPSVVKIDRSPGWAVGRGHSANNPIRKQPNPIIWTVCWKFWTVLCPMRFMSSSVLLIFKGEKHYQGV